MILPLSLLISLRFQYSYNRISIISFISIMSFTSIAISVTALIVGLSIINGFNYELNNRVLSVVPHGEIEAVNQPWLSWQETLKKIRKIPGILFAAPYVSFNGLAENNNNIIAIQIKGIDPQQEERLSALSQFVQNNAWNNFKFGKQKIIIGKGVANTLKVKQGDKISVMISSSNTNYDYKLHYLKKLRLCVIGIIQLNSQLDNSLAIIPLKEARRYLSMQNSITGIAIKVNKVFDAKNIVYKAGKITSKYVYIKNWIDTYGYLYRDIQMIRTIVYIAMIFLIGISCFNIVSILMIIMKNKNHDIAILYTLGITNNCIRAIFFWYGLLIGIKSSLLGIIIGIIVSMKLTLIVDFFEKLLGYTLFSRNTYFINFLSSKLCWLDIVYILITVLLLSLLASLYPAMQASKINPVRTLSNY